MTLVFQPLWLGIAVIVGSSFGINAQAKPMAPCGSATVIAGTDSCETVAVRFDISACEDSVPEGERPVLNCSKGAGTATIKTAKAKYRVDLKENVDSFGKSAWAASGPVLRATLDDEAPAKPAPVAKKPTPPPAPPKPKAPAPAPVAHAAPTHAAAPAHPAAPAPAAPAVVAAPAPANPMLKVAGHFRLRAESSDYTDLSTRRAGYMVRIRPMFTFTPGSEVSVHFEPQFAKIFGERTVNQTTSTALTPAAGTSVTDTSGTTFDTSLGVHQGFVDYHPVDWVKFLIGRQVLSYGDQLLIGGLDWHNIARSFDAIRLRFTHGIGWTDVFTSKLVDLNTPATGGTTMSGVTFDPAGDRDISGIYSSFNLGAYAKEFDLYFLYQRDAQSVVNPNLWIMGTRAKSTIGMFDYRGEITFESGNPGKTTTVVTAAQATADSSAYQFDLEAGATVEDSMKVRFGAEFFMASKNYNQMYPTIHKFLGYADVIGRRNVTGFVLHASAKPMADLKLELDYHQFMRTSTDLSAFNKGVTASVGNPALSASKSIGSEFDLTAYYNLSKAVELSGGYSVFLPGSYLEEQALTRKPIFMYVALTTKF